MKVQIDSTSRPWVNFTDWLDEEICRKCASAASMITGGYYDLDEFRELLYSKADVGGIRDAILRAAQDATECEIEWKEQRIKSCEIVVNDSDYKPTFGIWMNDVAFYADGNVNDEARESLNSLYCFLEEMAEKCTVRSE